MIKSFTTEMVNFKQPQSKCLIDGRVFPPFQKELRNATGVNNDNPYIATPLTLKWSRGVPTLARKHNVIGRSPSLTLSNFTLRFFW